MSALEFVCFSFYLQFSMSSWMLLIVLCCDVDWFVVKSVLCKSCFQNVLYLYQNFKINYLEKSVKTKDHVCYPLSCMSFLYLLPNPKFYFFIMILNFNINISKNNHAASERSCLLCIKKETGFQFAQFAFFLQYIYKQTSTV